MLPAWSPDGQSLAFITGKDAFGIYRILLTGSTRVELADCLLDPRILVLSTDRMQLAFDGGATPDGLQCVYSVSVNGDPLQAVLDTQPATQDDRFPAYSPDGRHLACLRKHSKDLHHI